VLRDPDPSFHFDVDMDQTNYFDADPDPVLHQSDANLRPTDPSILSIHTSIERIYGSLWLHFEPSQITNFDFDFDPDPQHCLCEYFF
jgi:hypothetical protein